MGTWIALVGLPAERRQSCAYLTTVLGRPPRLSERWQHFFAFVEFFLLLVRTSRGTPVQCTLDEEHAGAFEALMRSRQPALFGSFHFGWSDLLGYVLGQPGRPVSILRRKLDNSADTRLLGQRFGEHVSFLWVNDPSNVLFQLKAALDDGQSVALKCDRFEFSSKVEPFQFLGAYRLFPFTIYHLAVMFARPVVFCVAIPGKTPNELRIFSSEVFTPDPTADRASNLSAARVHFQRVITRLETLVRRHPMLWFNFVPLNPAVSGVSPASIPNGVRRND